MQELNEALGESTVGGVAFNNKLPMKCAMRPEGPEQCSEKELSEDKWQGKIESAAPHIPVVQDTKSMDAWNSIFGAGHDDLLVYVDGFVYKYLPAKKNAKGLDLLDDNYLETNLKSDEGYSNFKNLILNLFQPKNGTIEASSFSSQCMIMNGRPESIDEIIESRSKSEGRGGERVSRDPIVSSLVGFLTAAIIACVTGIAWFLIRRVVFPNHESQMSKDGGFKSISQVDSDSGSESEHSHEEIELSARDIEEELNSSRNE